jgi:hypothetical protein
MPVALGPQPVKRSDTFAHSPDPRRSPAAHHPAYTEGPVATVGVTVHDASGAAHPGPRGNCRGVLCEPVDLCRDDEVVAGQALDGLGPEGDEDLPQVTVNSG